MATDLILPQLAMSMTEGQLIEWLVEDGAAVAEGQAIYTIEADKATQEIEAPAAGVLRRIGEEGETYDVGTKIGQIE
jgi:pyruvate/2-oxoglutarate dehydrogenase complex dihydrolipoamide acyltransferase (E2) component